MHISNIWGDLGNQMFHFSAERALALDRGHSLSILKFSYIGEGGRVAHCVDYPAKFDKLEKQFYALGILTFVRDHTQGI